MQAVPAQPYTYPLDNRGFYTYNMSVSFPVAYNQGNLDVPDLTYTASSPESTASPRTPNVISTSLPLQQTSKKSKSKRAKDPNHVGRPANSFMIFRSQLNAFVQKTANAHKINQQDISKNAAGLWKNLSSEEKQRYVDAAAEQSRKQRESHPNGPHSKPSRKRDSTSVKRARVQKPYDRPPNKTTKCVNDDVVPLEIVLSSSAVPEPSPEQWLAEPQPSQFIDPMLTQCIPTNVVDQTDYATVNHQFDLRLGSTYWQPMLPIPPSIDTTAQLPVLSLTEQNQSFALSAASDPFNFNNWSLSNETTSMLDDQTFFDQILSDLEVLQQS